MYICFYESCCGAPRIRNRNGNHSRPLRVMKSSSPRRRQTAAGKQVESDGDSTVESETELISFTEEEEQEYLRQYLRRTTSTPEEITITFVEALERAHQYFGFTDFLEDQCDFIKLNNTCEDVFLHLVGMEERNNLFNKLDETMIMESVISHIGELQYQDMLRRHSNLPRNSSFTEEHNDKLLRVFENMTARLDGTPFPDPIFELVHQARKGHPLHRNPVQELDKIKKSHSVFYNESFILYKNRPEVQYSESKVIVANLSDGHTDAKFKELLSVCGEVISIERRSSYGCPEAVVTFTNSDAAKFAPFLMGRHSLVVERIPESRVAKSTLKEGDDVRSIYERALAKYSDLRLTYIRHGVEKGKGLRSTSVGRHKRGSRSKSPGVLGPAGQPLKRRSRSRTVESAGQPLKRCGRSRAAGL